MRFVARLSQSPSLRGSGRFAAAAPETAALLIVSQSPSLRGSGRFSRISTNKANSEKSLNPLHCGAVVASGDRGAGRCGGARLNPLHCGAVVASRGDHRGGDRHPLVSIPFIAGQWSLPQASTRGMALVCLSQSPSLRGSGRFDRARAQARAQKEMSQSPSLRGSGRFTRSASRTGGCWRVSIPFIAGQWSLPLGDVTVNGRVVPVSIPFIAGQWSLRRNAFPPRRGGRCLNPLHCGAVVASNQLEALARNRARSQSPSLRGSGRFNNKKEKEGKK